MEESEKKKTIAFFAHHAIHTVHVPKMFEIIAVDHFLFLVTKRGTVSLALHKTLLLLSFIL